MKATAIKAAIKTFGAMKIAGATRGEIETQIRAENKGITPADVKKIADGAMATKSDDQGGSSNGTGNTGSKGKLKSVPSPNDELDLDFLNYREMKGEDFEKYCLLVGDREFKMKDDTGAYVSVNGSLKQNDSFDFVCLKARPIMVERFQGMEGSPWDYVGLLILNNTPIHESRMPVRNALELNSQILNAHSRAGHGKYYFLKK